MTSGAKRALGLGAAALLVVAIVVVVLIGRGGSDDPERPDAGKDLTVVNGVIGSEKKDFFDDPAVQKVFADHGYTVKVTTAGSRQMTSTDLEGEDFVFPSSAPAAQTLKTQLGAKSTYAPFYSPMKVASFTSIAELLQGAGLAAQGADGEWTLDMRAYLDAVAKGTRWKDLVGADQAYPNPRDLLISSTDIRQSNSAAMYLAIASYVLNGDSIVTTPEQQAAIIDQLGGLFLKQGFSAASSEGPYDEYLSQGIGTRPLVMIYEAQFLGTQLDPAKKSLITPDRVLMTPQPTVYSQHTLVPVTATGDEIGRLLVSDADLQRLAAVHGFRPGDPTILPAVLGEHDIPVPAAPIDVIDPPSYETLEAMIRTIESRYTTPLARDVPEE